jgi:hypothetical protein
VFDVSAAPCLGRTPRAMAGKLQVPQRGTGMVLAEHHTPVHYGRLTAVVGRPRRGRMGGGRPLLLHEHPDRSRAPRQTRYCPFLTPGSAAMRYVGDHRASGGRTPLRGREPSRRAPRQGIADACRVCTSGLMPITVRDRVAVATRTRTRRSVRPQELRRSLAGVCRSGRMARYLLVRGPASQAAERRQGGMFLPRAAGWRVRQRALR